MALNKILLIGIIIFYLVAGLNHFINPEFYEPLIPSYLPFHNIINYLSGFIEMVLGILMIYKRARSIAAYAIIVMLIAFIPAHIYFIQQGNCLGELCFPEWVGWVRLLVVHPLLIVWAWWIAKSPIEQ